MFVRVKTLEGSIRNLEIERPPLQLQLSQKSFSLSFLPDEILLPILYLLDMRSLAALSQTNKNFYRITGDKKLWISFLERQNVSQYFTWTFPSNRNSSSNISNVSFLERKVLSAIEFFKESSAILGQNGRLLTSK